MSDKTLDQLIAQLKSEAIDTAEKEAQQIIDKAKTEAQQILNSAKEEREQILSESKKEADDIISKGESALKQSARDLNVSIKNDLLELFKAVLEKEIEKTFTSEMMISVVEKVVNTVGKDVTLKLPADMEQNVVDAIQKQVQTSGSSISILRDRELFSGLSIFKNEEGWSYQITPQEVAELLNTFLSKKWIEILNR